MSLCCCFKLEIEANKPLEQDMNNEQVRNAQEILKGLGYVPGRTDGYFNSDTTKAVKAFQHENDMRETGKIDSKTAMMLEEAAVKEMKKEKNDLQLQTALRMLTN